MSVLKKGRFVGVLASIALLGAATSVADDGDHIRYRQQLMHAIGGHAAAIATQLKGNLGMPGHIKAHADMLKETAALVPLAFEAKVIDGPTDSKPEIWSEMDDFLKLNTALLDAAVTLSDAADSGDMDAVRQAMRGLGKTCGACHQPYRKGKEDSYKQPK